MHIKLDTKTYPIEAILNASYVFLDRAFIFLRSDPSGRFISATFSSKEPLSARAERTLRGDFTNELLHAALRYFISQKNKNVREYIVGKALFSTLPSPAATAPKAKSYKEDPLGIGIPWEQKYGRKKKK